MNKLRDLIHQTLLNLARENLDETAITIDPRTRHTIIDTAFIPNDEIDLDELSELLADAIDIKVDPAPEVG